MVPGQYVTRPFCDFVLILLMSIMLWLAYRTHDCNTFCPLSEGFFTAIVGICHGVANVMIRS